MITSAEDHSKNISLSGVAAVCVARLLCPSTTSVKALSEFHFKWDKYIYCDRILTCKLGYIVFF